MITQLFLSLYLNLGSILVKKKKKKAMEPSVLWEQVSKFGVIKR